MNLKIGVLCMKWQVEKTIDQVQEMGSSFLDTTQKVLDVVGSTLKPAVDAALPIAKQAGEEVIKIASPAISEATKKAQEAIQGTGFDTEPVMTAAKVWFSFSTEFDFLLRRAS